MRSRRFTLKEYLTPNISIIITLNILSTRAISKLQQEDTHRMLTLYRDDSPGAYIPAVSGILPTIVELRLPAIDRRDMKLLLRYPEPRRTATWIRMSFVACDEYIASSGVLYKAYVDALQPLISPQNDEEESTQKPPPPSPTSTPLLLLSPDNFSALLEKQIKGYEPYSINGKTGRDRRVITRGARARTEALTFPSTNRTRDLRQLKFYRKKGDLVYPEGDPAKLSTFAKALARDPLFMLPKETTSPFVARLRADSVRPDGVVMYYDSKGTEDAGFPGVSLDKKGKTKGKGKGKSAGFTQDLNQTASAGGATLLGQTGTDLLAAVKIDPLSVGGFGSIVRDAKDEVNAKRYMEEQRKLEIQRDLATLQYVDKQKYLEIQAELDEQRELDRQGDLAKQRKPDTQTRLDTQTKLDTQRDLAKQRKLEIQRKVDTQRDLAKQTLLEIQRELDTQRDLNEQRDLAKQKFLVLQAELNTLTNEVATEDRNEALAAVQPVAVVTTSTRAVETNKPEEEDDVARASTRSNTTTLKPTGSFEAFLVIRNAASKRLGTQKGAMIVNLTHLAASAEDHTSDATKVNFPEGAISFIEQVEQLTAVVAYRRMHELQKIRKAKARLSRVKEEASKAVAEADAGAGTTTAPVSVSPSPTFMELALRPPRT